MGRPTPKIQEYLLVRETLGWFEDGSQPQETLRAELDRLWYDLSKDERLEVSELLHGEGFDEW